MSALMECTVHGALGMRPSNKCHTDMSVSTVMSVSIIKGIVKSHNGGLVQTRKEASQGNEVQTEMQ